LLNVDTSQDGQVQIKAGNYFERNFKDIEER
jgi:purine operon repressor